MQSNCILYKLGILYGYYREITPILKEVVQQFPVVAVMGLIAKIDLSKLCIYCIIINI